MEQNPMHNIGDEVSWNSKAGVESGKVIEVHITITKDSTFFSYLIELPNTKHMFLNESSIIKK